MKLKHTMTKFSVGTFINGAYSVFGILQNGILRGIILKTNYPNMFKRFSFVELKEIQNETDKFPQFLKKLHFLTRIKLVLKSELYGNVTNLIHFIDEVSDLPSCVLRYKNFIDFSKRNVLIEKYSRNNMIIEYFQLNKEHEFNLIKIIAGKYGKHDVVDICYEYNSINYKKNIFRKDMYCPVKLYTCHNKTLYAILRTYRSMSSLYEIFISGNVRINKVQENIEKIIEKKI